MGALIAIADFRKKRCLDALRQEIGLPEYCAECDTCDDELLALLAEDEDELGDTLVADLSFASDPPHAVAPPRPPARLLQFTAPDAPAPARQRRPRTSPAR